MKISLNTILYESIYFSGNSILKFLQFLLYRKYKKEKVHKVLIFRTGSIGDTICAMPAMHTILENFSGKEVDLLINPGDNKKVSPINLIDTKRFNEIIDYSSFNRNQLIQEIKKREYDLFIELPQYDYSLLTLVKHLIFPKLAGIKSAFGWRFSQHLFFKKAQERKKNFLNERDRLNKVLREEGLEVIKTDYLFPEISFDPLAKLQEHGVEADQELIGIVIGSNRDKNMWPVENFEMIADNLINRGYKIIAVGGPKEKKLLSHKNKTKGFINFCAELSPMQSAIMLKKCKLVISNDTGPMHMAYAMNTPVISLFSSRDFPGKWYPPLSENKNNHVFRTRNFHCSICFGKPCAINNCMLKITVLQVQKVVDQILEKVNT